MRKRIPHFILATLLILSGVFLFSAKVDALPLLETKSIRFDGILDRHEEVNRSNSLVKKKSKKVEIYAEDLKTVSKTKKTLKKSVSTLKREVSNLDNMFVKIDRYAPNATGNTYAAGNCTWYVKSMRPDLPNRLGNAELWYSNAQAQGWNVGTLPKKGAVATTTEGWAGHVAYVIGVSLDQEQVTIREMNYGGLYNMNTRTVHASEFKYIYELN